MSNFHTTPQDDCRKNGRKKRKITTKQLVYCAAAMALALVCSMIKLTNLPMGGSVTLFSMLFIVLTGYWYGPYAGITTAAAYGLLQFVLEPVFYTLPQVLVDYPLAFGALGLAGFFHNRKYGLQIGYIVGVIGRYLFAVLSGIIFFGSYAPDSSPLGVFLYSATYNASYLLPEAVITMILISIPAVSNALKLIKQGTMSEK